MTIWEFRPIIYMTIPSEGKRTAAYHINTRQKSKLFIYRLHNMYMKKTLWYFKKPFFPVLHQNILARSFW